MSIKDFDTKQEEQKWKVWVTEKESLNSQEEQGKPKCE